VKIAWVVACQRALLDQTNNISLIQVIEEIGVPTAPVGVDSMNALIQFPFAVVALWSRSVADQPESAQVRARMLGPNGRELAKSEAGVDLMQVKRSRLITQFAGVPYRGPGVYVVTMEVAAGQRWRRVGSAEFTLHHNVPASAQS